MDSTVLLICIGVFPVLFPLSIRCKNGMNHLRDRVPHLADGLCQYAHQYNNKVLICKVLISISHMVYVCDGTRERNYVQLKAIKTY